MSKIKFCIRFSVGVAVIMFMLLFTGLLVKSGDIGLPPIADQDVDIWIGFFFMGFMITVFMCILIARLVMLVDQGVCWIVDSCEESLKKIADIMQQIYDVVVWFEEEIE